MTNKNNPKIKYQKIGIAASIVGVDKETLRRWDKKGKLTAKRHPMNGYRLYDIAELNKLAKEIN